MYLKDSQERQHDLILCLYDMSKKELCDDEIKELVCRMKAIYKGGFRHSYADFFPLVVEVFKSEEYNHEYLGSNLEALKNWVAQAGMEQKQNGLDEE